MKIALMICFVLMVSVASAQSKYKFHSLNSLGILDGERETALQLNSINGFQRSTWFGGVGVGLDYYYETTLPLFISFSKYLNERHNSFFLSVDGGTNIMVDKSTGNRFNGFNSNGKFKPGLYYGGYVGYKFGVINHKGAVILNLGYSRKEIHERFTIENEEKFKYNLRRISFRMGWMF